MVRTLEELFKLPDKEVEQILSKNKLSKGGFLIFRHEICPIIYRHKDSIFILSKRKNIFI